MTTLRLPPVSDPLGAEKSTIDRQREALRSLIRLVAERAASEAEVERTRTSHDATADGEYRERKQALEDRFEGNKAAANHEDSTRRRSISDASIASENQAKDEFARASRKIAAEFDAVREQARSDYTKSKSRAIADFESGEKGASAHYAEARKPIDDANRLIESRRQRLSTLFEDYKHFGLPEPPLAPTPTRGSHKTEDPLGKVFDRLQKLEPNLLMLEGLVIPKSMKGKRYVWIFVILAVVLIIPMIFGLGPTVGLPLSLGLVAVGGHLLKVQLYKLSRNQVGKLFYPLMQSLIDAEALVREGRATADEQFKAERLRVAGVRDEALQKAKAKQVKTIADGEADRDERLRVINEIYAKRKVDTQTKLARDMREAVDLHDKKMAEIPVQHEASLKKLADKYEALKEKVRSHHESAWNALSTRWHEGMAAVRTTVDAVAQEVAAYAPRWDDPSWSDRPFPRNVPPLFRIGETRVDLDQLPGGESADARLREGVEPRFTFPALLPFPDHANLLVEGPASARTAMLAMLQSAMFRLLTSLPPGQVRFTIVDPIGIGRNFGAFMHLADYDEALVNGRVLTEAREIDDRLAEISAHMEKVTQKYLRNEYATIDEYNAVAGEVAEPYRVLVIADFPTGFDEKSAARLAGISAGGTPCGVITLVARDLDRPLPLGLTDAELRSHATLLAWNGEGLNWSDPDFSKHPLILDAPPSGEFATRLIQKCGAAARDAKRVEVPFEFIAPASSEGWWKLDSRTGIDIPLGKAGATKRQHLTLGKGTSQHVLVAGRTGSGKSTLLHALIVNVALNYSPDEVELYLIDFKKGVEFKVYATEALPHAAVIAIESEREFGISVLHRLDTEMRQRADRFRDAGVQDLNGYRNQAGTPPCPRILLIVDEFQEFFVEEDKLAQEAALLLDRLVRQGRAFGVHVHLGSQSLGGAYALARTTLGQMAVRIALQCSESDAHLILSEQNSAAKLLSRPGEAIYNDANGSVEGNHFFQVVWLSDERREAYLQQLRELAIARPPISSRIPIVFEGDAEADPRRNLQLAPLLEAPAWPRSPRSSQAWLGDPVAIKEATSVLFRRQGGNHLLIVGQNAEGALGIMSVALIGLAAQYPPSKSETVREGARFIVIDGTPEDDQHAEFLPKVAGKLAHPMTVVGWKDAPRVISELGEELARRQQPGADDGPEIFLLIHDLGRFRDLRRKENDFGFGTPGEAAIPADHLAAILKEGSALGVHLLVWSDTLSNLNRVFDNQSIREFESRVLFQISPTDSAHLLDSPAASKLGPNRALFASEEHNRLEKFRPYGLPTEEWLETIARTFEARVDP